MVNGLGFGGGRKADYSLYWCLLVSQEAKNHHVQGSTFHGKRRKKEYMSHTLFYFVLLAMLATLVVLGIGIFSLVRGGHFRERWSNKLMRLRILFQAIAIVLLMLMVWAVQHGH
jgi:ABC-type dipeptide/oligopeptide/nickel transport system permease subunit